LDQWELMRQIRQHPHTHAFSYLCSLDLLWLGVLRLGVLWLGVLWLGVLRLGVVFEVPRLVPEVVGSGSGT
jgi:hypothetical protein